MLTERDVDMLSVQLLKGESVKILKFLLDNVHNTLHSVRGDRCPFCMDVV